MAELSVNCPKCQAPNSVALGADVETYVCTSCGEENPLVETGPEIEVIDPLIGATISECKITQKLGEGGFGAVYKAMDQNLQRPVALKVMLQSLTSNQEFVQKFIREAITAAQLNHPNIVAIHKVGRDEKRGIHYLIMELLEGQTLEDVIADKGIMKPDEAVPIILQAAEALGVAHDKNIVHRDIKPENLMLTRGGVVKIMDFGLAKVVQPDMKSTKVMGTPHFMSPEQFEGKQVDGRTDIYSLGVTFYYLLSKARPYEGTNTVQIIYAILTSEPKSLLEAAPDVPQEIWDIIKKMIHKDVNERYASFRDVRKDLLSFQEKTLADKINCPQCSARNQRGKKFCRQCGFNLQVKCPACGADEVAGVQTCGSCGAQIETLLAVRQNLERAGRLKQVGDLRRAYLLLKETLKLDPECAEAKTELDEIEAALAEVESVKTEALELEKTGNLEDALKKVEALLGKFPGSDDIKRQRDLIKRAFDSRIIAQHMKRADENIAAGNLQAALVALDAALRLDPEREDIVARRKDLDDKVKAAESARSAAKEAFEANRYAEAFRLATEVLKSNPTDAEMAQILEKCRGFLESSEDFVKRGREHFEAGRFLDAKKELEAAAELRPDDTAVTDLIGQVEAKLAGFREQLSEARAALGDLDFDGARAHVTEVLKNLPGDPEALGLMATIARQEQETRKAREVEQALEEAERLEGAGDLEAALDAFRRACDVDPDNAKASKARDALEERLREVTSVRNVVDEHLRDGRFEEALEAQKRLLKLLPDDEMVKADLEETRVKVEHIQKALQKAESAATQKKHEKTIAAAEQVLELSPAHVRAAGLKRDAERALGAIERHTKEAERLIGSEIFEEALEQLEKARAKGATDEMLAELEGTAKSGITVSLKTEATRFYAARDYGAALDAYERILDLDEKDADAIKGKKEAEKRLKALTSEPLLLRSVVAAAAAIILGMFQIAAVQFKPAPAEGGQAGGNVIIDLGPQFNFGVYTLEAAGDWAAAREAHAAQQADFNARSSRGLAFIDALTAAQDTSTGTPVERIRALQEADALLGQAEEGDVAAEQTAEVQAVRQAAADAVLESLTNEALAELKRAQDAEDWSTANELLGALTDASLVDGRDHLPATRLVAQAAAAGQAINARNLFYNAYLLDATATNEGARWAELALDIEDTLATVDSADLKQELRGEFTTKYREDWMSGLRQRFGAASGDADALFALVTEASAYVAQFDLWDTEDDVIATLKGN